MSDPAAVVRRFFALLEEPDTDAAVALLHEDVSWHNTGLPTFRGKKRVGGMLRDLERRNIGFEAHIHHLAAAGGVVLTERTDVLRYGPVETSFWVCGTLQVEDGLIRIWDDKYSPGNLLVNAVTGTLRRLLPGDAGRRAAAAGSATRT